MLSCVSEDTIRKEMPEPENIQVTGDLLLDAGRDTTTHELHLLPDAQQAEPENLHFYFVKA